METLLTSIPWSNLGAGSVLFFAILAIIRGDLVTRREHESVVSLHRNVAARERANADQAMSALRLLANEHGTTTDKILSALPIDPEGADTDDS